MLKKFDRFKRIKMPNTPPVKKTLTDSELKYLLDGVVVVEEKLDGGIAGIARVGEIPIVQGKGRYIPQNENSKQVFGLWKWVWEHHENVMKIPEGWIVFGEWLRVTHNIYYDDLPDYFVGFDIWDGTKYLSHSDKIHYLSEFGFYFASFEAIIENPTIERLLSYIDISHCSSTETMEGLVFKNQTNEMYGKYVRREFDDALDVHWLKKPIHENKLGR